MHDQTQTDLSALYQDLQYLKLYISNNVHNYEFSRVLGDFLKGNLENKISFFLQATEGQDTFKKKRGEIYVFAQTLLKLKECWTDFNLLKFGCPEGIRSLIRPQQA